MAGRVRMAIAFVLIILAVIVGVGEAYGTGTGGDGDGYAGFVAAAMNPHRELAGRPLWSLRSPLKHDLCNTDTYICDTTKNERCCRGRCRNLHSDALHCGQCGSQCLSTQSCCSATCTDLSSDRLNCGKCGNPCQDGLSCSHGLCGYAD